MPAPVVVVKDVGGFVHDYEAQTAIYRMTGREVRLHECRSACTLALGLPNVCVYPDSILKFHQAYDPRNKQANDAVSQRLFDSYPLAVRARLGGLTRAYRVLRGSELIALGIRNCNDQRTLVAARALPRNTSSSSPRGDARPTDPGSILDGVVQGVMAVLDPSLGASPAPTPGVPARSAPAVQVPDQIPLPPRRPPDLVASKNPSAPHDTIPTATDHDTASVEGLERSPRARPGSSCCRASAGAERLSLISGAQDILPARFTTYVVVQQ